MKECVKLDPKFIDFYWTMKKFNEKAKKYGFGNGCLPQVYTEKLCRSIFNLEDHKGKDFDAVDKKGCKIEIKATISDTGITSINPRKDFDLLYWLYFDFSSDQIVIRRITGEDFRSNTEFQKLLEKERSNVTLSKFLTETSKKETICVGKYDAAHLVYKGS